MEITTRYRPLIVGFSVVVMCILLSALAASSAQLGQDEPEGPYEPNGTIDQARKITVCTPQTHLFDIKGDVDWLKFRTSADVRYTIETFDLSEGNDTKLWLYDAEENPLAENDDDPDRPPASRIDWIAPEQGTYYVRVAHPKVQGGSVFTYSIHLAAEDPGEDSFEPDNAMEEATEIDVGGGQQGHTLHGACGGDADWFSFRARSYYAYNIQTSGLGGGNDTMLCVYDEDGTELACNDDDPDHYPASRLHWEPRRSGTYYVKVTHFHPFAGGDALTYDFQVTRALEDPEPPLPPPECADDFERDDVPGNAKPILVNGAVQNHTFHEAGDEDWVKFWAFAGDTYTIETSDLELGNDTYLFLYDADLREESRNDDISAEEQASRIVWEPSESGTYYVKVRHKNPSVPGCLDYKLEVVSAISCADAFEPDNEVEAAKEIEPGEEQHRTFHVACTDNAAHDPDGADWVKFRAHPEMAYTIRTSSLGGNNDTVLELYAYKSSTPIVTNDDYSEGRPASEIVWTAPDILESNYYYVKVSPFDPRVGGCAVDYTLEVIPRAKALDLRASPRQVPGNGIDESLLTACVSDTNNIGMPGARVYFESTLGSLTPVSATTDASGCATCTLASSQLGRAVVTATVGSLFDVDSVDFRSYLYLPLGIMEYPPLADFTAEPRTGMAPLEVCFSDTSSGGGAITGWQWDFGDGSTSSEQNPCHTYSEPHTYDVSLTIDYPGGSSAEEKQDYVVVTPACVPPPDVPSLSWGERNWCDGNDEWCEDTYGAVGSLCTGQGYETYLYAAGGGGVPDLYYIDLTETETIEIVLEVTADTDYDIYVYEDQYDPENEGWDETGLTEGGEELSFVGSPGRYFIEVYPYYPGDGSSEHPYTLTVTY